MTEKRYCLDENELTVLLAGYGIRQLYTIGHEDNQLDKKDICMSLHSLYKSNLIEQEDKSFVIEQGLKKNLGYVNYSRVALTVYIYDEDRIYITCCYLGRRITVVKSDRLSKGKVSLYLAQWDEILEELLADSKNKSVKILLNKSHSGELIREEMINSDISEEDKRHILMNYYEEGASL